MDPICNEIAERGKIEIGDFRSRVSAYDRERESGVSWFQKLEGKKKRRDSTTMPVWREAGDAQHVYKYKELVTFQVHHGDRIVKNKHNKWCYSGGSVGYLDWYPVEYINMLEMWEQVKLLGHVGKVSLKGVVPLSYQRVVLIYVQHIEEEGVAVNEDCEEVGVPLNEDIWHVTEDIGPLNNYENGAFIEGSGPLNNDKEGRPFTESHGPTCTVEDWDSSDDDGPLNNEDSEDSEEEDKEYDPDFVDSTYEQSENECELLKKDDKAFENYVDHPEVVEDPNAPVDEDHESTDIAKSDVESLDSSSNDEDDGNQKKRKRKLPKFHEFRLETNLCNPEDD
ncbi:uncharacterized protein Pyn_17654 [Prunus yedoensis var. nudiflora]|uniref:Uncharacterized protein n=1 Tax=Prunus yedoensis var. nudiflora TaxID=2094558 RepID=A0A314YBA2_PRUYE|nr:uncharacterized protein Pyn_17654 [Prunus yedoensis var. nudiflora]